MPHGAVPRRDCLVLGWGTAPSASELRTAIEKAAPAVRLEVDLPADAGNDLRVVLIRAGFRLEGVARSSARDADGRFVDQVRWARLASDSLDDPVGRTAVMNATTPRKRLISHALVRDERERVLLCETSYKPDWEQPLGLHA